MKNITKINKTGFFKLHRIVEVPQDSSNVEEWCCKIRNGYWMFGMILHMS